MTDDASRIGEAIKQVLIVREHNSEDADVCLVASEALVHLNDLKQRV